MLRVHGLSAHGFEILGLWAQPAIREFPKIGDPNIVP